jgi:branched-chain amino acid transport system substrate-binding protein
MGAALSACSAEGADNPYAHTPVNIGLLRPQTGERKLIGDELKNGFNLYLEQHGGQLGGHPATMMTSDEGDSPENAKSAADGLLKRNVLAISGVAGDQSILEIRDLIEKSHIPLVGSHASPAALRQQTLLYMWHTSFVGTEPGRALGLYLRNFNQRVSMVAASTIGGRDAVTGFQDGWGGGGPKLANPHMVDDKTDLDEVAANIRSAGDETVFCALNGARAIEFIKAMRKRNKDTRFYAPGTMTEGSALEAFGGVAKDVFTAMNYSTDLSNGANLSFSSAYRARFSTPPTAYAVASWDAAQALDKAIKACGDHVTPDEVNLKIGGIGLITSPRGLFQFNQTRTPQQKWYLRQVRNDGPVLVNALISDLDTLG